MSLGVRSMREPIWYPLLRMERWVRQAAFWVEVVPEVNWMLMMSVLERYWGGRGVEGSWLRRSRKGVVDLKGAESMRPEELSTRIKCLRVGTVGESRLEPVRSGISCWNSGIFERGGLNGRLVSVLMIKCEASR